MGIHGIPVQFAAISRLCGNGRSSGHRESASLVFARSSLDTGVVRFGQIRLLDKIEKSLGGR